MKKRKFDEGGLTDAEDKATGLAASGKEAPVGFFKRLMMGNIDKADSEAGQQFGAGRARLDRMPAAPDRSKTMGNRNMEGFDVPRPVPEVNKPLVDLRNQPNEGSSNIGIASIPTSPSGYKRDTEGEAASELARESRRASPTNAPVKSIVKPRPMKDLTAGEAREGPAAQLAADKMGDVNPRDAEKGMSRGRRAPTGEIANLDSRAVRDRKTAQMMIAQDEKLRKKRAAERLGMDTYGMKKGGGVKAYAKGGSVSASSRGDGCAQRGKTRGTMR